MMIHRHFQDQPECPQNEELTKQKILIRGGGNGRQVVYFGSRAIYADMVTAVLSLLAHTAVDKVYLLTEDDEFPFPMPECVENINVRDTILRYNGENNPNYSAEWTYIGLSRTTLTKIFPDTDKILSIDCDTIVTDDIGELWDIDLTDYDFAGVREPRLTAVCNILYINAGVTMFNLKRLRESGRDDMMIEKLRKKRFQFICQDVMNIVCEGQILEIPSEYNACPYTRQTAHPKIVHFAGNRTTWRSDPLVTQYRDAEWETS